METSRTTSPRRRASAVVAAALFALPLAACGDDDAAATPEVDVEVTEPTTPTLEVTGVDFSFQDLPSTIEAGTAISFTNDAPTELHELVAIRLPDDETRSVDELVALPPAELAAFFPNVTDVIIAPPGEAGFPVEGDGVIDETGRYLFFCAIPTGADPAEYLAAAAETEGGPPQVDGGPPHFVQGMYAEVVVE